MPIELVGVAGAGTMGAGIAQVAATAALDDGVAYPRDPLRGADEPGLDVVLQTIRTLQQDYGGDRYRPAVRLRRLVQAGRTGRRAGRGFYDHEA